MPLDCIFSRTII